MNETGDDMNRRNDLGVCQMTTSAKTTTVRVSFTGWDWDDTYTMRSPTGRTRRVRPNGHWSHGNAPRPRRLTPAEEDVLASIRRHCETVVAGRPVVIWGDPIEMVVSYESMRLFALASEKTD